MNIPSTSSGSVHIQHGGTPKSHNSVSNRPGFKFNTARVPQVGSEVCIYFIILSLYVQNTDYSQHARCTLFVRYECCRLDVMVLDIRCI